jgi:hypothetical protein
MGGTSTTYLTVNANNGNVGIGTTSPAHKLDVAGDACVGVLRQVPGEVPISVLGQYATSATGGTGYTYIQGRFAYATSDAGAVTVFDISDPANPFVVGQVVDATNLNSAEGLAVIGPYLFVTVYGTNTLYMLDTRKIVGTVTLASATVASIQDGTLLDQCEHIEVSGNLLLIACTNSTADHAQFAVVQVTGGSTPGMVIVGSISDSRLYGAVYIDVEGTVAYVTARFGTYEGWPGTGAVVSINISSPAAPAILDAVTNALFSGGPSGAQEVTGICARAGWAYVAASSGNAIVPVNVSNPSSMTFGTPVQDSERLVNPSNVHFAGQYLYVTTYGSTPKVPSATTGITVLSLASPSAPAILSFFNPDPDSIACDHLDTTGHLGVMANGATPGGIVLLELGGSDQDTGRIGHFEADDVDVTRDIRCARNLLVGGMITGGGLYAGVANQGDLTGISLNTPYHNGALPAMLTLTISVAADVTVAIATGPTSPPAYPVGGQLNTSGAPVSWSWSFWLLPYWWFEISASGGTATINRLVQWY